MATGIGGLRERLTDRWLVRLGLVATILCGLVATVVWQRLGWAYRAAPETDTLHGALVSVAILSGAGATAGAVLGFRSPGIGVALVVGVVVPVALVALLAAGVQGLQQPCGGPGDCASSGRCRRSR